MNYQTLVNEHIDKSAPVSIIFGSPHNRCQGLGICEINPNGALSAKVETSCKPIQANLIMTHGKQLGLLIPQAVLSDTSAKRHLSGTYFEIQDEFTLPGFITEQFGLVGNHHLPTGLYTIIHVVPFILILF